MVKSEMKTAIKKVKIAVAAGDRELADNLYREAASCIDKAAKRRRDSQEHCRKQKIGPCAPGQRNSIIA